jgi:endogenous inhibitor of DNA gyrase (YacG/DUF329 family)
LSKLEEDAMLITCSRCGSESVRMSKSQSFTGKLWNMLGCYGFRCLECDHLFRASIWHLRHMFYAKCPRCHRLDLSKWDTTHYNPPFTTSLAVACAAKPVRCEYCRNNFWSFRRVKIRFDPSQRAGRSPIIIPAKPRPLADPGATAVEPEDHSGVGSSPQLTVRSSS